MTHSLDTFEFTRKMLNYLFWQLLASIWQFCRLTFCFLNTKLIVIEWLLGCHVSALILSWILPLRNCLWHSPWLFFPFRKNRISEKSYRKSKQCLNGLFFLLSPGNSTKTPNMLQQYLQKFVVAFFVNLPTSLNKER